MFVNKLRYLYSFHIYVLLHHVTFIYIIGYTLNILYSTFDN